MIDLRNTIAPKSDQLNADDMIAGPKTICVTKVSLCAEPEQPIAINFEGDNGKPYKPCKSMRRVLVTLWGADGSTYVGRSMTIYRDEKVKFGGAEVGGIRISHLSGLDKPVTVALTVTKSVRRPFQVKPLIVEPQQPTTTLQQVLEAMAVAEIDDLDDMKTMIRRLHDPEDRAKAIEAGKARRAQLETNTETEIAA